MDGMCGRYAGPPQEPILHLFSVEAVTGFAPPSGNIAPTQTVNIVIDARQPGSTGPDSLADAPFTRELRTARWGLVPSWAPAIDPRRLLINARSETVTVKPSFRAAATSRRAIVPATGYYEWALEGSKKVPYFLHPPDDSILGFAGLYEWWRVPEGTDLTRVPAAQDGWLCSMTIITRSATDALGHIHDRMPVVVPPDMVNDWLSPLLTKRAEVDDLLGAMPDPVLTPTQKAPAH